MSQQIYNATKEVKYTYMIDFLFANNSFLLELFKEIIVNVAATIVVHRILSSSKKAH